jgi:hypothetical protein
MRVRRRSLCFTAGDHRRVGSQLACGWRRIALCSALLSVVASGDVLGQSLDWARAAGGLTTDQAVAIAVDLNGNSYVTGTFAKCNGCQGAAATFGAGGPNETTLTSVEGSEDIFVAKYDSSGALMWAKGAGGIGGDLAWGVAVDASGNSYVTGVTGQGAPMDFGGGVVLTPNFDPNWLALFVVKYDGNGNALWVTKVGITGGGFFVSAVAADAAGNSYVTGSSPDPVDGGNLITVWKVDANGTVLWTKQATGVYSGTGTAISADGSGNSLVTGLLFTGTATFGAGEPNETDLSDVNGASGEMFLAKYDSSGRLMWAKQSADTPGHLSYGVGVSTDSAGNAFLIGVGPTILGLGEPTETSITTDNYVAKYDLDGHLAWARPIAGRPVSANGVSADASGNSYITGSFATSITFAAGQANQTTLLSLGGFFGGDIFVAKYDASGNFLWARQAGSGANTGGISVDSVGNPHVAGTFSGTTTFGPGEPGQTVLTSSASSVDIFVAKLLHQNRRPVANAQTVNTAEDTPVAITLTASDPDGDLLTYTTTTFPLHGLLTGSEPNLTYTPNPNYHGRDSFMFNASDGSLTSADATVTIDVASVNDVPIGVNDEASTERGTTLTIAVLANDTDADGDLLSVTAVGPVSTGTVQVNANGTVTYTPSRRFTGVVTFPYTVSDGNGGISSASVTVTVVAPNAPPRATTDRVTTNLNTAITINVLANDSDPDGDALQIIGVAQPVSGIAVLNANQTITYTPNAGFTGRDMFSYTIDDDRGGTATGQVVVTVRR